ncbi:MAG: SMI1/KNR4 family protein [Cyclobacteriaceae bacterium]|jgi:hypothetical protein
MSIEFRNTESPIHIVEIEKLEKLIELKFPIDYVNHLLKFNGGRCSPNRFSFLENKKETTSSIDWFLAIYDGEFDNLERYILNYKVDEKRLPADIIPIAHDSGGNLVCISAYDGKIYFWDHEKEVVSSDSGYDDFSNLYLVSNDFNNFLNNLF